jgi:hypothetical protein
MGNRYLTKLKNKINEMREKGMMNKYKLVVCFCVINGLPLILKVIDPDVARKSSSLPARLLYGGKEYLMFDMPQSFNGCGELHENQRYGFSQYIVKSSDGITIEVFDGDRLVYSFESAVVRPDLVESSVSNVEINLFSVDTNINIIPSLIERIFFSQIERKIEG